MSEVYKRMSLIIPPDLHRAFKTATAADGKQMTDVLLEFIREYVEQHKLAAAPKTKRGRR
jgi:hypothetical protein